MFWKKEKEKDDSECWSDLLKIIELLRVEQSVMKKDIEMLNIKVRSRVYKPKEPVEEEEEEKKSLNNPVLLPEYGTFKQNRKSGF